MKNPFYLTLIAAVPFAACVAGGLGFPQPGEVAAKTIRSDFKAPPPGYGEVPFWWWSGRDPLNKERMLEQIALRAAVAGLPERERAVIRLRFDHGLTQQRCAAILKISQVQVSRLERRAVERLREQLQ